MQTEGSKLRSIKREREKENRKINVRTIQFHQKSSGVEAREEKQTLFIPFLYTIQRTPRTTTITIFPPSYLPTEKVST